MEVTVQARSDDYVTHSDDDDNDEGNDGQIPGDLLLMMTMSRVPLLQEKVALDSAKLRQTVLQG